MKKVIKVGLMALMVFAFSACEEITEKSAVVKTVKIGSQIWMAENLNDASKGGKCYDDKLENCEKYGRLYTWAEAVKACPTGWHLSKYSEWNALQDFVAGSERKYSVSGGKLKAKNGWDAHEGKSGNGTDEYGFSALPGGISNGSVFDAVGGGGFWWSVLETSADSAHANMPKLLATLPPNTDPASNAYFFMMGKGTSNIAHSTVLKSAMLSLRCVKD